ncbi:MAG: hypothetical protein EZS28_011870 [Streblomastix strix]|uniref:Uncharacterized protein n=1 Tax=Streblomastix strix TaxID=222440 RepID=A0A5J4WCP7_9EUKA|nr:MAG: hypothetical protein EZS28_011870 [Streblomastix strix]
MFSRYLSQLYSLKLTNGQTCGYGQQTLKYISYATNYICANILNSLRLYQTQQLANQKKHKDLVEIFQRGTKILLDVIDYGNRVAYSTYAPLPSDIPENLVFEAGYIQPTPNTLQMQKSQLYKERLDEVKQYLSAQMSGQTLIDETPIQTNITGEQKLPIVDSQPQLLANKFSNPAMIAGISPTFINQMNRMKQLFKIGNAIEKDDDDESSEENETETKKDKLN